MSAWSGGLSRPNPPGSQVGLIGLCLYLTSVCWVPVLMACAGEDRWWINPSPALTKAGQALTQASIPTVGWAASRRLWSQPANTPAGSERWGVQGKSHRSLDLISLDLIQQTFDNSWFWAFFSFLLSSFNGPLLMFVKCSIWPHCTGCVYCWL